MIKHLAGAFAYGVTATIGTLVGIEVFNKLKDPCVRKNIKNRFIKIKDIFTDKEES